MRQFVSTEPLQKGCLCVEGKNFRYMSSVLRVQEGDMMDVRLPGGALQPMTVAKIDRNEKKIILQVAGQVVEENSNHAKASSQPLYPFNIWLLQFVAKPPKMDLIIRQAVECGVAKILPVEGIFCQKGNVESARKKSSGSDDRWNRIVVEARQQSGSPVETEILPCVSLKEACQIIGKIEGKKAGLVFYEQSESTVPVAKALENCGDVENVFIAVGAEGGISPDEVEFLKTEGFSSVHIKTNILRCETAALYAVAAVETVLAGGQ